MAMGKAQFWRNGWVVKLLERVAERDDFLVKPVRYRATTRVLRPLIRANNFQIHVWLPIEMGAFVPTLARLTRDLKRMKLNAIKRDPAGGNGTEGAPAASVEVCKG
jgi:hypothetical protein